MCCALCCFLNHYKQKCKPNLIMILIASLVWVNRVTGTIHNNTEYWHHVRVTWHDDRVWHGGQWGLAHVTGQGVSHNSAVITPASHGTNTSSLAETARFVATFQNITDYVSLFGEKNCSAVCKQIGRGLTLPCEDGNCSPTVCGSIENSVDVPSKCGPTSQNTIYFVFIMFYVLLCTITVSQYQNRTRK